MSRWLEHAAYEFSGARTSRSGKIGPAVDGAHLREGHRQSYSLGGLEGSDRRRADPSLSGVARRSRLFSRDRAPGTGASGGLSERHYASFGGAQLSRHDQSVPLPSSPDRLL